MAEGLLSTDDAVLDGVPLERLEAEIAGFASRLAAATAQWLVWVGAYDRRRGWESWEMKSCAHWLNWQCGVSPRAAREQVQVARKLESFALVREVFLAGELSYSKVRAVCRVVEPENEAELVRLARDMTASQLDRMVAKLPRPGEDDEADAAAEENVWVEHHGDGTATLSIRRPVAEIAAAKEALYAKASQVIDRQQAEGETKRETIARLGGIGAVHADTATALLTGEIDAAQGTHATVLVVADLEVLTGANETAESTVDSRRLNPDVVRRLCCDGIIQTAVETNGETRAVGAEQRIVPRRIRRLVLRRDHGICQFPGCTAVHRLHAHHVVHWAHGGPTELGNLISLCHFHHHSVHERGWNVAVGKTGGWIFTDPQGNERRVPVLRLPTKAELPASSGLRKNGAAAPLLTAAPLAGIGERCDINYVADVLTEHTAFAKRGSQSCSQGQGQR